MLPHHTPQGTVAVRRRVRWANVGSGAPQTPMCATRLAYGISAARRGKGRPVTALQICRYRALRRSVILKKGNTSIPAGPSFAGWRLRRTRVRVARGVGMVGTSKVSGAAKIPSQATEMLGVVVIGFGAGEAGEPLLRPLRPIAGGIHEARGEVRG